MDKKQGSVCLEVISVCVSSRGSQQEIEKVVTFTPTQSKLTVKQGTISMAAGETISVAPAITPAAAEIEEITVASKPAGFTVVTYPETKSFSIAAKSTVSKGSYTIVLNVLPRGAAPGTAPTKLTVKVSIR